MITLTGSVTVTNSSTSPVFVEGRDFNFWAHTHNRWIIPISGTVPAKSMCTIQISKSVLELGDISFSQLSSATTHSRLNGMSGTVNVISQCTGVESEKINLKTTAPVTDDSCVEGDNKSLNFCAESGGQKIDINGREINISGSDLSVGHSTEVTIYATKGKTPKLGKSSSNVIIAVSPD